MRSCIVIGAGIAGIAAAIRLAARGYQVDVYEANDYPGGKLRESRVNGYRFDMGPSVFTLPELIDELFTLCGKNPRDYFSYSRLETNFKYFFEGGTCINAYADVDRFAAEISAKSDEPPEHFRRYLKDIEEKFNITNEVFIENSLHVFKNYLKRSVLYGLMHFNRIDAFSSMYHTNRRFFKDPRLVQLFDHYASYVGSNPLVAPATLNLISHLVISKGAYVPDQGMYGMVKALVKLAEEMKVKFHYSTLVEEILIKNRRVAGVRLPQGEKHYDIVVSNMDIYFTYHRLLPTLRKPRIILNQAKSSSIVGFYWGVKGSFPALGVHNMLFAGDERKEYKAVFDQHITARQSAGDAPAGCENWFIIVTAPSNDGQNWNALVERARQSVFKKVQRMLGIDVASLIECEQVLTPPEIEQRYRSAFGAVYGNSSNSKFAAFLRHPNFSRKVKGLYFVGGSVHPGSGIPMCLNSAKIMDKVLG
jgi:phytoene desaturase